MQTRASPLYCGHVFECDPHPAKEGIKLWRVRIHTPGEYFRKRATIDLNHVPLGINIGQTVEFNLTRVESNGLVATNVVFSTRSPVQQ